MGILLCHPHVQTEILQGTCIKLQMSSHTSLQHHFSTKYYLPPFEILSYNKTNQTHYFLKFIFGIKLYMFPTVPLSIIRSFFLLYTQQCYISYRFTDRLRANLFDIYHCCVYSEKLQMMDRGTVRNMQSFIPKINLRNQCIQVVLL